MNEFDLERVKASIILITQLYKGQVKWLPHVGSNWNKQLYKFQSYQSHEQLTKQLESDIRNEEDRISSLKIEVTDRGDSDESMGTGLCIEFQVSGCEKTHELSVTIPVELHGGTL